MALVDWEAVVLDLEDLIRSKNSHGQRDLLAKLAELRSQHRQLEGLPEKALRLYGSDLYLTRRPAGGSDEELPAMDDESLHRRESTTPEGEANASRSTREAVHS